MQCEVGLAAAEKRIAVHDLEQSRAALGTTRELAAGASQCGFTVRATSAGRVLRVLQTSEGVVTLGTPLFEIGDTHRLEIVAELLTTDALTARSGSRVMIERWGGPTTLEGRAPSVEPADFTKVSALGDGYRVSVSIVTLAENKAVQVPVSAAWIRSGLAPGQQVIVYPPAAVQDGVHVKARKV